MKTKELNNIRIGDWVELDRSDKDASPDHRIVTKATFDTIVAIHENKLNVECVKIHDAWLRDFNFEHIDLSYGVLYTLKVPNSDNSIQIYKSNNRSNCKVLIVRDNLVQGSRDTIYLKDIKYVHQIQFAYEVICGKKLEKS